MASSIPSPRSVSLLALKEDCDGDGDGDGGVNDHSSESGSIEPQSHGVDCNQCDAVNVNVTPDVCDDSEKSHSGNIFGVDGNECESGGESCAGVKNPLGKIFEVDGYEIDLVNVTLGSGGERVCEDAKKLPSGNPNDGGERVCANAEKPYGDISGVDAMETDSLEEEETCLKCNGGGEVLLCSERGCPVALHEKCLGSEPLFDDSGKFYCPYCLYNRAIARTRELKRKAMEAKKELSSFLYPKVVGDDKGEGKGKQTNAERPSTSVLHGNHLDHDNVRDNDIVEDRQTEGEEENLANRDQKHREVANHQKHPSPQAARDGDTIRHGREETIKARDGDTTCHGQEETIRGIEDLRDSLEREKQCEDETSTAHQFEIGTVQEEELREHEHGPCVGVGDNRQQAETSVDGSLNTSTKQARGSAKVSEEIHRRNKEQIQPQGQKTVATRVKYERRAKQRTRNTGNPYSFDFDSPSKLATQLKDVAEANTRSQVENPITCKESRYYAEKSCKDRTNKSRQRQESTRQAPIFFNGKRKRLLWTAEEEEMIKKGVSIMSSTANKNIPWRKILESGSHVFHPSRNPSDLKDKWKTLSKVSE